MPSDASEILASPIGTEDVTAFVPGMSDIASDTVAIVNLAGHEALRMRDCMNHLADRAGLGVSFVPSDESRQSFASDNTNRKRLLGDCTVPWREGMVRAIDAHYPGAFDRDHRPIVEVKENIWGQR